MKESIIANPCDKATIKPARGRPREFNRDVALRKAKDLFRERGYAGTSISDLTATLGISLPSLYGAFGDKKQLFHEAVQTYTREDAAPLMTALANVNVLEAIHGWLLAAVALYAGDRTVRGCLVVTGAINTSPEDIAQIEALRRMRADVGRNIRRRLQQAEHRGELKPGSVLSGLAEFYHTYLQGLAIRARDGQTPARLTQTIEAAMLPLRAAMLPQKRG